MSREDVLARVTKVVVEQMAVSADQINESTSFQSDLEADSLTVVELVMAFEEEFGIEIPDGDADSLKTVGSAVDYIISKQAS